MRAAKTAGRKFRFKRKQMILKATLYYAKKLNDKLFLAPKGYGMSIPTEVVERQYREGFYSFLDSVDEMANYMVTVGYIRHFAKSLNGNPPRLLDLGCSRPLARNAKPVRVETVSGFGQIRRSRQTGLCARL